MILNKERIQGAKGSNCSSSEFGSIGLVSSPTKHVGQGHQGLVHRIPGEDFCLAFALLVRRPTENSE